MTNNDPNAPTLKHRKAPSQQQRLSFVLLNPRLFLGLIALILAIAGIPLFLHYVK